MLTALPTVDPAEAFEINPPSSVPATAGVWYPFTTAHCGIFSPVDFDGSYWIPTAVTFDPEYLAGNSTEGRMGLIDTLEFRAEGGFVARFRRLDRPVWPWMCD